MTCWSIKERRTIKMAGFNFAQNIIGLKKGSGDIHELELEVAQLSASVLTIKEQIDGVYYKPITMTNPSITVQGQTVHEFIFPDKMAKNEQIVGFMPKYMGEGVFTFTNCYKNVDGNIVVTVFNGSGSARQTNGNISGVVVYKKA